MISAEFGTGQVVWSFLWFFLFALWFALLLFVFRDLTRRQALSGWAKALWFLGIVILPYLGVLLYLIVMEPGVEVVDRPPSPVTATSGDDLARLNELLASGDLDAEEYERALAKLGARG